MIYTDLSIANEKFLVAWSSDPLGIPMPWISRLGPQGAQIDAWIHTSSGFRSEIHGFFKFLCFTRFMIFYNLPFHDIFQDNSSVWIISALPFPWSPMVRLSADRRGNTWSKTNGNSQQRCDMMALGPMLNYPFVMEVPEVLRRKNDPSRWKRGHVGLLHEVPICWVVPSIFSYIFEYHHEVKNKPLHTVYGHEYLFAHIHIFVNKIAITIRFLTQHKIQNSKIMKPPGTIHHFSNFMKQLLPVLVLSTRPHLIDLPQFSRKFLRWIVGTPKENPALIQ